MSEKLEIQSLTPRELRRLIAVFAQHRFPLLIQGAPGVGKSALVDLAAQDIGYRLIITHPVTADPTDAKGFPGLDVKRGIARWYPYGDLVELLEGHCKVPTIFFIDDLGQASTMVQAAFMQLILARRINEHKVSDLVTFVAATNRREDRAGVSGILEPVKSRFHSIVQLNPDRDSWIEWAINQDMPPELIGFISLRPDLLMAAKPSPDMVNGSNPRTIANAGDIMRLKLPERVEMAAIAGAAGPGFAAELAGYLRIARSIPDLDTLLAAPESCKLPGDDQASLRYAIVCALAHACTVETFAAILTIAERMGPEYGMLAVMLSVARTKDPNTRKSPLKETSEFTGWARRAAAAGLFEAA